MNRSLRFLPLFLLISTISAAQPSIKAVYVSKPPTIDGWLNDEAWTSAAIVDELYQREPNPGQPVSEKTVFYVCHDASHLYVGIKCYDDPKKITAKEMARDVSLGNDDRIQVILDTYLDHRNGYWFQIGPRGSIGDVVQTDPLAAGDRACDHRRQCFCVRIIGTKMASGTRIGRSSKRSAPRMVPANGRSVISAS